MVGLGGLEPPTSRLSSARSNQLSYKPGRKTSFAVARPSGPARGPMAGGRPSSLILKVQKERRRRRNPAKRGSTKPLIFRSGHETCRHRQTDRACRHLSSVLCSPSSESRKEVIQPQVPLRLPCYDFTPVADPTVAGCLLIG